MSLAITVIVMAVIIAVLLFIFIAVVSRIKASPSSQLSHMDIDWSALNDERVRQYLPDRKINAIKAYRDLTGAGLKTSKFAVEYAIANPDLLDGKKARSAEQSLSDAGLREMVEDGQIDEAAELYRQFTGVDEYTARDYIDNIENQLREQR